MQKLSLESLRWLKGKNIQKVVMDLTNESDFSGNESLEKECFLPKKFTVYKKRNYKR